jgi:putative restriction endonuclease
MAVRMVVAVTDRNWFDCLRRQPDLTEVNFWYPSPISFKALQEGELLFFKLHAPVNKIAGWGVYDRAYNLPLPIAWDTFGVANGANNLAELRTRILRYRRIEDEKAAVEIGCLVLTQPIFLPETLWFPPPPSWSPHIQRFRGYSTDDAEGRVLWDRFLSGSETLHAPLPQPEMSETAVRYGDPVLIRPRRGQGAFRLLVTEIYGRRCAITRERTLPALEAAHIRPYSEGGGHVGSNGILMRRDVHSLFDAGYVTVTPDYLFEVSKRIREEFENGRDYYSLNGKLIDLPLQKELHPSVEQLRWHNSEKFLR